MYFLFQKKTTNLPNSAHSIFHQSGWYLYLTALKRCDILFNPEGPMALVQCQSTNLSHPRHTKQTVLVEDVDTAVMVIVVIQPGPIQVIPGLPVESVYQRAFHKLPQTPGTVRRSARNAGHEPVQDVLGKRTFVMPCKTVYHFFSGKLWQISHTLYHWVHGYEKHEFISICVGLPLKMLKGNFGCAFCVHFGKLELSLPLPTYNLKILIPTCNRYLHDIQLKRIMKLKPFFNTATGIVKTI